MNNFDKFLLWEAKSRDTIDFKKVYVDIAGDLIAGLLLSQIIYWYLPDEHGRTKLRVQKRDHLWIAKARDDWWSEIRITAKQFDRAANILIEKGVLIKDHFRFDGLRTIHIRLDYDRFMELWQAQLKTPAITQKVTPQLPKGETRNYPKVKPAITQRSRPLTESTAETTTETISPNGGNGSTNTNKKPTASPQKTNTTQQLTNKEADELLIFGKHPDNDTANPSFDTIQEIQNAGWQIRNHIVEQAIAYYLEAVREHHTTFAVPNNESVRKDWYNAVVGHLQDHRVDELKVIYPAAIQRLAERGMTFSRPGSLTKSLPDVAMETQTGDVVAWL